MNALWHGQAMLSDGPGFVAAEEFVEISFAFAADDFFYLQVHHVFVAGAVIFVEHAEGSWEVAFDAGVVEHADQDLGLVEVAFVMDPEVVFADAFCVEVDDGRFEAFEADAFILLGAENEGFALFEKQGFCGFGAFFGEDLKGAVVEYITVLIDLEERGAFVLVAADEHGLEVFGVTVHASGDESGVSAHGQGQGVEGVVDASERGRLGEFIFFGGRGVLSFCQTIDLVVEQQDIDVEVSA